MSKHTCPACGHQWRASAKKPSAKQYSSVPDPHNPSQYIWTTPSGRTFRASFPGTAKTLSAERAQQKRVAGWKHSHQGVDWLPGYLREAQAWQDHWGRMAKGPVSYEPDQPLCGQEHIIDTLYNEAHRENEMRIAGLYER